MWGSLSEKDFDTVPALIECKKFMERAEKKLQRKRKYPIRVFNELKAIITDQLHVDGKPEVLKENDTIETRMRYVKESNPFIEAVHVTEKNTTLDEVTLEKLLLFSRNSDAYDITIVKTVYGGFYYQID